jgi:tRNA-splicing ligase RtcB
MCFARKMSFLQLDLPADQVADKTVRRALIDAILERTPTGPGRGQRSARKAHKVGEALGVKVATDGASAEVLHALCIPLEWTERCEDAEHVGHDGTNDALATRLDWLRANQFSNFVEKVTQLGSYGGGNHFGECVPGRPSVPERHAIRRDGSSNSAAGQSHGGQRHHGR